MNLKASLSFLALFILIRAPSCLGYCWQAGKNPGFTDAPQIRQLAMDRVLVSWEGLVTKEDCADNYVVKYWQRQAPSEYKVTDIVEKGKYEVEIIVVPKVKYMFQAVAREEKGIIGGVDWNKSPTATFLTSTANRASTSARTPRPRQKSDKSAVMSKYPEVDDDDAQGLDEGGVLGLSIEIFVIIVVAVLLLCLIIVGILYRLLCGKSDDMDDEDSEYSSESGDDSEKENMEPQKNPV